MAHRGRFELPTPKFVGGDKLLKTLAFQAKTTLPHSKEIKGLQPLLQTHIPKKSATSLTVFGA